MQEMPELPDLVTLRQTLLNRKSRNMEASGLTWRLPVSTYFWPYSESDMDLDKEVFTFKYVNHNQTDLNSMQPCACAGMWAPSANITCMKAAAFVELQWSLIFSTVRAAAAEVINPSVQQLTCQLCSVATDYMCLHVAHTSAAPLHPQRTAALLFHSVIMGSGLRQNSASLLQHHIISLRF